MIQLGNFHCLFGQFALKFHWVKTCFGYIDSVNIEITFKLSYLLLSCPNQSTWWLCRRHTRSATPLTDKIRPKYEQLDSGQVWVTWHPSIWCWSLWIGTSTCLCEWTLHKTEPVNSKGIIQAHMVFKQTWRHFSDQNSVQAGSLLGCGGCSFVPIDM